MPPFLSDTRPEADAVQIGLFRHASPQRRLSLALSLSGSVCGLSRRAIRRANPGFSDEEVGLRFVALHYGAKLADAVRAELARRP